VDRVTLTEAIKNGPVELFVNDDSRFVIQSSEFAIVDKRAAYVLTKDSDGEMRTRILSLANITRIEVLDTAS